MGLLKKKGNGGAVLRIPLDRIRPNTEQPRRYFEEKSAIAYDDSFDYEEAHLFEQLQNLEIYAQSIGCVAIIYN